MSNVLIHIRSRSSDSIAVFPVGYFVWVAGDTRCCPPISSKDRLDKTPDGAKLTDAASCGLATSVFVELADGWFAGCVVKIGDKEADPLTYMTAEQLRLLGIARAD